MASRYFVGGGTGNWDSTTNWAATDGGASGASFPIAGDTVFLTALSGAGTLSINVASACSSIDFTGFTGTLGGAATLTGGTITLAATMTNSYIGTFNISGTSTITSNGIQIANISFLTSNVTILGTLSVTNLNLAAVTIINGSEIHIYGDISAANAGVSSGTSLWKYVGTGTISTTGNGTIGNDFTIDTVGNLNSGNVRFNNSDVTCINGTVTGSLNWTIMGSCSLDLDGVHFGSVLINSNSTITLLSNLSTTTYTVSSSPNVNGFTIYTTNFVTATTTTADGTTIIEINGSSPCSWTYTSGGVLTNPVIINTSSTLTLGTAIRVRTGGITRLMGTVDASATTLVLSGTTPLDTAGITWNAISITAAATLTLNSLLTANSINLPNANVGFTGSSGFTTSSITNTAITANRTITFKAGNTYTITSSMVLNGLSNTSRISFVSSVASSYTNIVLQSGADCKLKWINATDADSSAGRLITTQYGSLLRTINWQVTNPDNFFFLLR